MFGTRKITLSFSVNWFIFVTVLALGLIVVFALVSEQKRPLITFIASVTGGAAALLAFVNALDVRRGQLRQAQEQQHHQKVQAAFDFMYRWNDPQFFHTRNRAGPALKKFKGLSEEERKKFLEGNQELITNMIDMLNVLEVLSLAIQKDIVDEETALRFFRGIIVGFWQNGQSFIEKRRAERESPRLFIELQNLFEKWKGL